MLTGLGRPTLAHTVHGRGPTLILIHGLVHRQHAWDSVVEELARHRRVITVDLPGHGDSPALPDEDIDLGPWMVDQLAAFVTQVAEPGEKPHVAGNSLGGYIALELAARGAVASATALSPAGFFRGRWDQTRTVITFRVVRAIARTTHPITPSIMRSVVGRAVANKLFYAKPWRVTAAAATIDALSITTNTAIDSLRHATPIFTTPNDPAVPITVAWGRRDLVVPAYQASLVRAQFPNANVSVHPGLGHVPMSDNPTLVASILLTGSEPSFGKAPPVAAPTS